MARLKFSLRRRWTNHTGNQGIDPLRIFTPTTIDELRQIVQDAERAGCTARAVGSGHSWSDVALTPGFLVNPTGLARPLELEEELLRSKDNTEKLVRVQSGMRIRELNAYLDHKGLALANMGGYDGQTVGGVISTSTHGSGLQFGPLSDFVRSLDIVGAHGTVYRVEPADGPTDPAAYARRHPDHTLKQDDHWFNAVVVGMGCVGLIYAVILAVVPSHYLREVRELSTWTQVRKDLEGGAVLSDNLHFEVYFSPYPRADGEIDCLVTTRNKISADQYRRDLRRSRNWLTELAARLPFTPWLINLIVGIWPQLGPRLLMMALKALVNPDFVNRSYNVLNIGAANYLPAYSGEIGVPIDDRGSHFAAVDRIVEIAGNYRRLGSVYHTSPISLRFVKSSNAYMSMMQGRDTMMIELIMTTHTEGGMELIARYEDALYELGGRPHWGQLNTLTGSRDLIASLYPQYEQWQRVHHELNSTGVFDSPFAKRVGISRSGCIARLTQTTAQTIGDQSIPPSQ